MPKPSLSRDFAVHAAALSAATLACVAALSCATGAGSAESDAGNSGNRKGNAGAGASSGASGTGGYMMTDVSATSGSDGSTTGAADASSGADSSAADAGSSTNTSNSAAADASPSSATTTSSTTSSTTNSTASSSGGGCTMVDIIVDGGFEQGPQGNAWTSSSSNFGTPICDVASCGNGGGSGPNTGSYWSWFGGAGPSANTLPEVGTVSQSVIIPMGMATLQFQLQLPLCDTQLDYLEVRLDSQVVFTVDGGSSLCGQASYSLQSVDVSSFADGNSHTLQFYGETFALLVATNFMVDDVALFACQ